MRGVRRAVLQGPHVLQKPNTEDLTRFVLGRVFLLIPFGQRLPAMVDRRGRVTVTGMTLK